MSSASTLARNSNSVASESDIDSSVVSEIDSTVPDSSYIAAKVDDTLPDNMFLAVKKDGREACDAIYMEEEGGYGYRLRDKTSDTEHQWRFARTADFRRHYDTYSIGDATVLLTRIAELEGIVRSMRKTSKVMYKMMGKKSQKRLGKNITDNIFGGGEDKPDSK